MKILFLAPYVPSRIRVRPFQFIKELAKRHQVYVIALDDTGANDSSGTDELAAVTEHFQVVPHSRLCGYWQSLQALPSRHPMCAAFCRSRAMEKAVNELLASVKFDLIHIEHLRAAHFAPYPPRIPVLFDSVDCLTGLFRQMAQAKKNPLSKFVAMEETWSLRWYEPRTLKNMDKLIVTTTTEQQELNTLDPELHINIVPNGVDTEYFSPQESRKTTRRIVFSGKMSYSPNAQAAVWFGKNVFPILRASIPDVEFVIVGSGPPLQVKKLSEVPGITVTGYTEDIRPHLASASVAVAPMQIAVGIQNKVLEAMAMGIPVVTTGITSRSLGCRCPGVVEADSADGFAQQIMRLVSAPEHAVQLGRMGRKAVEAEFSWQSSVTKLESLYEEMIAESRLNTA